MSEPASGPSAPRQGQLVYYVLLTLWFGTGLFRSDSPWQFWLSVALTVLGVSCVHGWVKQWRQHRAWLRSHGSDHLRADDLG